MKNKNRKILLILSCALIFVILFSHLFVIAEADHDCVGENCEICQTLQSIEGNLKDYIPKLSKYIAIISTVVGATAILGCFRFVLAGLSLIDLKVKLTN